MHRDALRFSRGPVMWLQKGAGILNFHRPISVGIPAHHVGNMHGMDGQVLRGDEVGKSLAAHLVVFLLIKENEQVIQISLRPIRNLNGQRIDQCHTAGIIIRSRGAGLGIVMRPDDDGGFVRPTGRHAGIDIDAPVGRQQQINQTVDIGPAVLMQLGFQAGRLQGVCQQACSPAALLCAAADSITARITRAGEGRDQLRLGQLTRLGHSGYGDHSQQNHHEHPDRHRSGHGAGRRCSMNIRLDGDCRL